MARTMKRSRVMADEGSVGGFTIIEVVLVLAIAGLIFLMVFLALPTLQRAQRDSERRTAVGRMTAQIQQFQTNNNGRIPWGDSSFDSQPDGDEFTLADYGCNASGVTSSVYKAECFLRKYMNSSAAPDTALTEFVDPDGATYGLTIETYSDGLAQEISTVDFNDHMIYMVRKGRCEGESVVKSTNENSRDYAIFYKLEGSGVYCSDNNS